MPNTPPIKKQNSKLLDVAIIPGGWGGKRHYTKLCALLSAQGITSYVLTRRTQPQSARLVITHSVGSLEAWEQVTTKGALLLGPIFSLRSPWSRKQIHRLIAQSRRHELRYQLSHHKMLAGLVLVVKSTVASISDPRLMHHQFNLLLTNNLQRKITSFAGNHPTKQVLMIRYQNDGWTDSSIDTAFPTLPNIRTELRNKPHDDILYSPEDYVSVITELLS